MPATTREMFSVVTSFEGCVQMDEPNGALGSPRRASIGGGESGKPALQVCRQQAVKQMLSRFPPY
jgi:hypothetical protein